MLFPRRKLCMLGYLFGNYSGMYGGSVVVQSTPSTRERVEVAEFQELKHRVDSLELACAGLWQLLKQAYGLTDDQLKQHIQAVDAADGAADGKITKAVGGVCPRCGHKLLSRTANKCLWCGAPLATNPLTPGDSGS